MRTLSITLAIALTTGALAQQIEVSEPRKPYTRDATVGYTSTKAEATFDAKKPDPGGDHGFGTKKPGSLLGYTGKLVSWFGVVRELPTASNSTFLIEHKYYDGLNDAHMQLSSIFGAGDFRLTATDPKNQISRHCLIRVIGTVSAEKDGTPTLTADYVRVWRMGDYAFMDYGVDASNARWKKLREGVAFYYSSEPDAEYYENRQARRSPPPAFPIDPQTLPHSSSRPAMNTEQACRHGQTQCVPLEGTTSSTPRWNRRIIIGCLALAVCLQIGGWLRGRWWVLSDADVPGYGQTACCTLLLSRGDVSLRQAIHESLSAHTDIASRLNGVVDSKSYGLSLFSLGYIKISAPAESIGQVATTARDHLASAFPSSELEYRLGFAP